MNFNLVNEFNMGIPMDSVEWCNQVNYEQFCFTGSYRLNQDKNERVGKIFLMESKDKIEIIDQKDTFGVFDMKWSQKSYFNENNCLGVAGIFSKLIQILKDF
jgi:hypothetical protein